MLINSQSDDLKHRHILVTGASGFHGTWLTKYLLDQGAHVTTILADLNPKSYFVTSGIIYRVNCIIGDIQDYHFIKRIITDNQINTIFHLAAVALEGAAFQSPLMAFDVNIRGTYNILDAARTARHVERVVVASSDKVYGDSSILPYTEELPLLGINPYDVSKVCGDLLAQSYYNSYKLPVAIGRFGNIYGGGDLAWSRLIPGTIRRLLNSESPVIRVPTSGQSFRRDFLYVKDLVNAYIAMFRGLSNPALHGQAFNFAMGGCWTVMEVVQKLQELLDRKHIQPQIVLKEHQEILAQHMSFAKAEQVLGWKPQYSLEAGLEETVAWYCDYLTQYENIQQLPIGYATSSANGNVQRFHQRSA